MPYSYTQFSMFKKCRAKFKYKYIDKLRLPKPAAPAAQRGLEIHKNIEDFLGRKTEELNPAISFYGPFMLSLRDAPIKIEAEFAVNEQFELVPYDDGSARIRGYIDVYLEDEESLQVYEWKTGKVYPEHDEQRLLYGTIAMVMAPTKPMVTVTSVYLDQKDNRQVTYHRGMLNEYFGLFRGRMRDIETCDNFTPNPTYLCRYCEFSKPGNGGPCQF